MKPEQNKIRFYTLVGMVLAAALYRILPHPWNFSPLGAISLFGGAYLGSRIISFAIPLITIWISDLIINNFIYGDIFKEFTLFYDGFYWQYGSFMLITLIGISLKNRIGIISVATASLFSSVLFFMITNFGTWVNYNTYPHTAGGLFLCYIAGLPYFSSTLFGDLIFCTVLFAGFEILQRQYAALRLGIIND